jgi:hypothetical protein
MEPAPVVVPNLTMVSDEEENPEEMIPEEDECRCFRPATYYGEYPK